MGCFRSLSILGITVIPIFYKVPQVLETWGKTWETKIHREQTELRFTSWDMQAQWPSCFSTKRGAPAMVRPDIYLDEDLLRRKKLNQLASQAGLHRLTKLQTSFQRDPFVPTIFHGTVLLH